MNNICIKNLGLQEYKKIFKDMIEFTSLRSSKTKDEIWLLEHYPVFTQGRHGKSEHILNTNNIPIISTDRGGQVTYHAPGQVIIYFLFDIKKNKIGVKKLISIIELACINMFNKYFNFKSHTINGANGIYVNNKKIASIGLRIKQGKSYHGIAINTKMDITPFKYINPCGFSNLKMCQLSDFYKDNDAIKKVQHYYIIEFISLLT